MTTFAIENPNTGKSEDTFDRFAINRALAAQLHLDSAQMIYVQEDHFYGYDWNV